MCACLPVMSGEIDRERDFPDKKLRGEESKKKGKVVEGRVRSFRYFSSI